MSTPSAPDPAGVYASLSPDSLFEAMADSANRLIGEILRHCDLAATDEERQRLMAEILQVRDQRWAVQGDDRDTLLALIAQWNEEHRRLRAGRG